VGSSEFGDCGDGDVCSVRVWDADAGDLDGVDFVGGGRGGVFFIDMFDELRLILLGDLEVRGREPMDGVAVVVGDHNVDNHDTAFCFQGESPLGGGLRKGGTGCKAEEECAERGLIAHGNSGADEYCMQGRLEQRNSNRCVS
jgi:hypothetical protein